MYLSNSQVNLFGKLLQTFFRLPYSTDLDGKDAETLLRIVKGAEGSISRRKELFDIIDNTIGYSVKTLKKSPTATRVDLQEQRLGDVERIRSMHQEQADNGDAQGGILLSYMRNRILQQMDERDVESAKSLILLKHWDTNRENFAFRYWEEDFLDYIETLYQRNLGGEIEWVVQSAGLHGRDRLRQDRNGNNVRLIRMHYKHNQIFTDHDIPTDAVKIEFQVEPLSWLDLLDLLD